ncbi:YdcH family protein [Methylomicrobium lacus]|uniref:YdcH family protein n=1 Tax=Methylomicrobium lacus TaxID=136992 RepID=UPI0035A87554
MLGEKHHLALEFPEFRYQIHVLKTTDSHFARLYQEYNDLDDEIRRTELEIEAHSDEFLENLKLRRIQLKDELYAMLQKASE